MILTQTLLKLLYLLLGAAWPFFLTYLFCYFCGFFIKGSKIRRLAKITAILFCLINTLIIANALITNFQAGYEYISGISAFWHAIDFLNAPIGNNAFVPLLGSTLINLAACIFCVYYTKKHENPHIQDFQGIYGRLYATLKELCVTLKSEGKKPCAKALNMVFNELISLNKQRHAVINREKRLIKAIADAKVLMNFYTERKKPDKFEQASLNLQKAEKEISVLKPFIQTASEQISSAEAFLTATKAVASSGGGENLLDDIKRLIDRIKSTKSLCPITPPIASSTAEAPKQSKSQSLALPDSKAKTNEQPDTDELEGGGLKNHIAAAIAAVVAAVVLLGAFSFILTSDNLILSPADRTKKAQAFYDAKSFAEAVEWYKLAAAHKSPNAQYMLGICFANGQGVEKSSPKAAKWFKKAAEQGYAKAQGALGESYYLGRGVEKSDAEAVKWWQKAAEQGHAKAQFEFGKCYYSGRGVEESNIKATEWWQKAANQGYAEAQDWLGYCYQYGIGVEQSHTEAAKLYRKAAEQGYAKAQYTLGLSYHNGEGVEQSDIKAAEWWQKAANQGHTQAKSMLEQFPISPEEQFQKAENLSKTNEYDEAVRWYRKAAEQGHAVAQNNLGVCYQLGQGVEQSYTEAAKWYRKAAEQGQANAQYNLGGCYYLGRGVEKSDTEAVKWYRKAAEQGHAKAIDALRSHGY